MSELNELSVNDETTISYAQNLPIEVCFKFFKFSLKENFVYKLIFPDDFEYF